MPPQNFVLVTEVMLHALDDAKGLNTHESVTAKRYNSVECVVVKHKLSTWDIFSIKHSLPSPQGQ